MSDPSGLLSGRGTSPRFEECCVSIAELDVSSFPVPVTVPTTGCRRRTSTRSSPCSAACCCPRTPSPTCVEVLKGTDFYRPAHELIYDAILDLYGRGEPADADHRRRRADQARRPRPGRRRRPTCTRSSPSVPTAANAGYYAQIVARARRAAPPGRGRHPHRPARLRRAAATSTTSSTRPRPRSTPSPSSATGEDYLPLGDIIEGTLDEIEAHRLAQRRDDRRAHRLHRPGPADQRPAPRPDDRHRRPPAMGKSTLALDFARSACDQAQACRASSSPSR